LKDLLLEIDTGEIDTEITGFDMPEIEELMTQFHIPEDEPEFNETIVNNVKMAKCPQCGHEFPI